MKCWLHGVTVVRRPIFMSAFPHLQNASKARLDMVDAMHGVTGMWASNVYARYSTPTTSVDSSLDCRCCHRLSSRDLHLCRLLLRQPRLLMILLHWTCLVAYSPWVLEHCSLGTRRAPLGSPLCVPSVHGASLPTGRTASPT